MESKVLLDTNIIIYRESDNVLRDKIGLLFKTIDNNPSFRKYIHPATVEEISKYSFEAKRNSLLNKLHSYNKLESLSKINSDMLIITALLNKDSNDVIDDKILNELYNNRVELLITEDKKIKQKANLLGIGNRVKKIDEFIDEYKPVEYVPHNILDIEKVYFGDLDINDEFFDSLKADYPGFVNWYNRKSQEEVYCYKENQKVFGLLFLKHEAENEDYSDIVPTMNKNKKLKISTFKVGVRGRKIGERFMKIIFDQAIHSNVDEVYVTIYNNDQFKENLIQYFEDYGFEYFGLKNGKELVYIRNMQPKFNKIIPTKSYPYININSDTFIIAIKPQYHTFLLPDSILRREKYKDTHLPVEYAIRKMYISGAGWTEKPKIGDNIIFYRSKQENTSAWFSSVLTTGGVVTKIIIPKNAQDLINITRGRTVYTESELNSFYNGNTYIIEFLYCYTLNNKLPFGFCKENNILTDWPKGVLKIDNNKFKKILNFGGVEAKILTTDIIDNIM